LTEVDPNVKSDDGSVSKSESSEVSHQVSSHVVFGQRWESGRVWWAASFIKQQDTLCALNIAGNKLPSSNIKWI
jgi:hypothetical protein